VVCPRRDGRANERARVASVALARDIEEAESALTLSAFYFARRSQVQRDLEEAQLAWISSEVKDDG
jgi:hypothetical protein